MQGAFLVRLCAHSRCLGNMKQRNGGDVYGAPAVAPYSLGTCVCQPAMLESRKEHESARLHAVGAPAPWHRPCTYRWDAGLRLPSHVSPDLPKLSLQGRASLPLRLLPWECGDSPVRDEM